VSKFKKLSNPILFLSDAPESHTGLGRVGRDLACLCASMSEFRVGYLARGGIGKRALPFTYYSYPESAQWGEDYLAGVAKDFFGEDYGIVFSNWDLTRLGWLAAPRTPELSMQYGPGRNWDLWVYSPVDSEGVGGPLGAEVQQILPGFDRVLAPSEWGMNLLRNSGRVDADWMPHLVDTKVFKPRDLPREHFNGWVLSPTSARSLITGWNPDDIILGCVMANQARKDYPVAFDCARLLAREYGKRFKFWLHTDRLVGYWNIPALAADYGIGESIAGNVTIGLSDQQLALRYSACDSTILPSHEGFGFPIAESLACGTPALVTDYAAGQELVVQGMRVAPVAYRIDTQFNVKRPVLSGRSFADAVATMIEYKRNDWEGMSEECRARVEHLSFERLKWPWMKWFQEGLR
jgi:glycosyltransferase involved in cell wall biosynthesis